jgi:hypothetical protein
MMEGQAYWHETGRAPTVSRGRSAATIDRRWRDPRAWVAGMKTAMDLIRYLVHIIPLVLAADGAECGPVVSS